MSKVPFPLKVIEALLGTIIGSFENLFLPLTIKVRFEFSPKVITGDVMEFITRSFMLKLQSQLSAMIKFINMLLFKFPIS